MVLDLVVYVIQNFVKVLVVVDIAKRQYLFEDSTYLKL